MIRRDGLTIEGAYSQSRCTPSRVSLMTGRYPFNDRVMKYIIKYSMTPIISSPII